MSTLNPPKKISRREELRQDQVVTVYARAWDFFDKNRMLVYGILAAIVLVALGAVAYGYYQSQRAQEAQEALARSIRDYEQENYRLALDGTETAIGLLAVADEYGGTEAGNLARYYAADALFRLGELDEALRSFQAYEKGDDFLGASAYAGEAAVYESQGDFARAGELYERAATVREDQFMGPQYLLNAGRAYAEAGQYAEALAAYEMIREAYPESSLADGVDFYIARVEAQQDAAP
jgi:tetratricopeptide (TPR) repeat protein